MQGIAPRSDGQIHQRMRIQVALNRIGADMVGLVGLLDMQRMAVGVGVDCDGFNPEFGAGADNADGDFTPIGNQYLFDHGGVKAFTSQYF